MKLSRIIASLKNALGLNPIENKRKLIFDKIKEYKLNLANEIQENTAKIDELIIELSKTPITDIDYIINRLHSNFLQKETNEKELEAYIKLEKYLNEEIEIELPNATKAEKKK